MSRRIYFDHAATTAISQRSLERVAQQMAVLGNPSSLHFDGRHVREVVESAREEIAAAIGSKASEVIFTASGTEANNGAIKGLFWRRSPRKVIVTTKVEHHAVLDPIHWLLEHEGAELREIEVDSQGVIDLDSLAKVVEESRDQIALISLIHTNNEIGTSISESELVKINEIVGDIPLHLDAVQSVGKVLFDFSKAGATSAAISAHKVGGPLGVAALILKHGIDITPLLHGGGQEREIRSGTLNAPGIVGFAAAVVEAVENLAQRRNFVAQLRQRFLDTVHEKCKSARINGRGDAPGIINITFPQTENEASLVLFDSRGISCSTGSACSQGLAQPSHVLLAIGLSEIDVNSSLRFSLSHLNTFEEIDEFARALPDVLAGAAGAFAAKLPSVRAI